MIDQNVFRVSREAARQKLDPETARDSFSYFIDVPNDWESARCPEGIIDVYGIHRTHEARFPEIVDDLGPLTAAEHDWARRFAGFYDRVSGLLSTTGARAALQFDIAETTFDWRTILRFVQPPARILDYGAGGGRQAVSAFLRHRDNVYVGVDSTLSAYTAQNLAYSFLSTIGLAERTLDLLDFEIAAKPFPPIATVGPSSCLHLPAWLAEAEIPERRFDLITACHVHNELSRSDFLRLIAAVDRGLADEGVLYMRSELHAQNTALYFDTVTFHRIDPVALLAEKGVVPVHCEVRCAYQTTVFARKGSRHHAKALADDSPAARCAGAVDSRTVTEAATRAYVERLLARSLDAGATVVAVHDGGPVAAAALLPALARFPAVKTVDADAAAVRTADVAAVAGPPDLVAACRRGFPDGRPALEHQYPRAPRLLYRTPPGPVDPLFSGTIRCAADVDRLLGRPPAPLSLAGLSPAVSATSSDHGAA